MGCNFPLLRRLNKYSKYWISSEMKVSKETVLVFLSVNSNNTVLFIFTFITSASMVLP